jgi:Membrane carboxypeptidase/penicillin-binding protein
VKVSRERAGGHGNVSNPAFNEISGESGLREDGNVGMGLEAVYLREHAGETGEVRRIVALSRLELNYGKMNRAIHQTEVAMRPTRRQPLYALRLAALALVPAALGAQQRGTPDTEAWQIVAAPQASLVLARDGSLIGEIGKELRTSVSIRSLPKYLPRAFVAVEDHRFYQHDGVDVVGIAGALKDNIFGEHRGASTITQQLVGNMHPTLIDRSDKSLGRKLREQSAAREMERHYTKEQILEAYLNEISFGHGWYGVESAARHYFGKSASKLSLAESDRKSVV